MSPERVGCSIQFLRTSRLKIKIYVSKLDYQRVSRSQYTVRGEPELMVKGSISTAGRVKHVFRCLQSSIIALIEFKRIGQQERGTVRIGPNDNTAEWD